MKLTNNAERSRPGTKILVVDDEQRMIHFIRMNLDLEGFAVHEAYDGKDALDQVRKIIPDLVILDVMMPKMDGFETLALLRENSNVPVIMLTARGEEDDRVRGLELGADDYVTKPFSPQELVSRVRAVLRRVEPPKGGSGEAIQVNGRLRIDFDRHEIFVNDELVKLRPTEYRLLFHLVQNAGWVVSHDQLLAKVWGYEYQSETHYLRLYVNYLREKLETDPRDPKYILTERGVGYRFVDYKRLMEK